MITFQLPCEYKTNRMMSFSFPALFKIIDIKYSAMSSVFKCAVPFQLYELFWNLAGIFLPKYGDILILVNLGKGLLLQAQW